MLSSMSEELFLIHPAVIIDNFIEECHHETFPEGFFLRPDDTLKNGIVFFFIWEINNHRIMPVVFSLVVNGRTKQILTILALTYPKHCVRAAELPLQMVIFWPIYHPWAFFLF